MGSSRALSTGIRAAPAHPLRCRAAFAPQTGLSGYGGGGAGLPVLGKGFLALPPPSP